MRLLTSLVALQCALTAAASDRLQPLSDPSESRKYELVLTWEIAAPDGFAREMILVNGQSPGPLIEAYQGEMVEITVHNDLPFNTTVHWHGIDQAGTPWSDGKPGVTQRPIRPGRSFVYRWHAHQYGSHWYHAHSRGQLEDGLAGPLVIHPARDLPRPFDLISSDPADIGAMYRAERKAHELVISDFRHVTSEESLAIMAASGIDLPCYDSILFNGKGRVDCWAPEKIESLLNDAQRAQLLLANETTFTPKACLPPEVLAVLDGDEELTNISVIPPIIFEECNPTNTPHEVIEIENCGDVPWVAINIVGALGLHVGVFSLDQHKVWIYAVDGSYIEPQEVDAVTVFNGNRYSLMIRLSEPGDFTMRFASVTHTQMITGKGVLRYNPDAHTTDDDPADVDESIASINDVGQPVQPEVVFFSQQAQRSFPADPPISRSVDKTFFLGMRVHGRQYEWTLNGTNYSLDMENKEPPLLFQSNPGGSDELSMTTLNGTWIDLVFITAAVPMPPHPIHKHGNLMWLIGEGFGEWHWDSVDAAAAEVPEAFNFDAPPKRDTFSTLAATDEPTWMVTRYHVTEPGPWFIHCHIQSHLSGGMAMVIKDGVDAWPTVPQEYLDYV